LIQQRIDRLFNGEEVTYSEGGNSMMPIIKHRQPVTAVRQESYEVGDVVFCKVRSRFYTHKIVAKNEKKGYQIANNKGRVNGWTHSVYAKVIKVHIK